MRPALSRALPAALLAALLAVPFFWRLDAEEFHGDESHWTTSGRQAFFLLTQGRLSDPQWKSEFYFYSQPQVGKALIGLAQALAGIAGPTPVVEYDWEIPPDQNRAAGRVPAPEALLAARVPGALAGWVATLLLWALAARLGAPGAGPVAALLLASHPLWLANSRRAGQDSLALCLGLAAALAIERATASLVRQKQDSPEPATIPASFAGNHPAPGTLPSPLTWRGGRGEVIWWLAAGASLGLAAGTKYVGVLTAGAGVALAVWRLAHTLRSRTAGGAWRTIARAGAGATLCCLAAAAVFVATNPALYDDPLTGLRVSAGFLEDQAAGMRQVMPAFASRPWVAAEIVDRTVWPTGFPRVVDLTMPEPLSPGSYGTPIVGLGGALAVLWLARRPIRHLHRWRLATHPERPGTLLVTAALWCAGVYAVLVWQVPTWWERWHLPLVPPLCLLAAAGLVVLDRVTAVAWPAWLRPSLVLAGGQYVAALAMEPSFLGRGFGQLVTTPIGAVAHLAPLAWVLVSLVHLCVRRARLAVPASGPRHRSVGERSAHTAPISLAQENVP